MQLIKGDYLTDAQRLEVKRAFIHWRYDQTVTTWEEWITKHAFYIRNDGHLASKPNHCMPAVFAEIPERTRNIISDPTAYICNSEYRN